MLSRNPKSPERSRLSLLVLTVLIPFSFGYFLLQFFRAVNATIAGRLTADLGLDAPQLGLLTSMYFLAAASVQLPMGFAIDRFGPARVQGFFLCIAVAGAALFAVTNDYTTLLLARFLIGAGVGSGLMAGLNAVVTWFPREKTGFYNGLLIAFGTIGAVASSAPVEWLLQFIRWQEMFLCLTGLIAAQIVMIFLIVPARPAIDMTQKKSAGGLGTVYSDPRFWRLAPVSIITLATAWALLGLWAAPWLKDVDDLGQIEISQYLFVMLIAQGLGAVGFGLVLDRARRRGVGPQAVLACVVAIFIAAELALALQWPVPHLAMWIVIGAVSAGTVISFTITAEYFPKELLGRANSALNVPHMFGTFLVQSLFGVILGQWERNPAGQYPVTAYRTAILALIVVQALALIWFLLPRGERAQSHEPARSQGGVLPVLVGLLGVLMFGSAPVLTHIANAEVDPVAVAMIRSIGGGVLALLLIMTLRSPLPRGASTWCLLAVAGLASYVIFPVLLGMGVERTSGAHAALMLASMPLSTAFIGAIVDRRLPGVAWFVGTIIAAIATALIILSRDDGSGNVASFEGDVLVLAASVIMALGFVACAKAGAGGGILGATLWSIVVGALLLAPFAPGYLVAIDWYGLSPRTWASLGVIVTCCGLAAQLAWLYALTRGGIAKAAPLQLLQPIFTMALAFAILAERPSLAVWLAALVVIVGVAISRIQPAAEGAKHRATSRGYLRPIAICLAGLAAGWGLASAEITRTSDVAAAWDRISSPIAARIKDTVAAAGSSSAAGSVLELATRFDELRDYLRLQHASTTHARQDIADLSRKIDALHIRLAEAPASTARSQIGVITPSIGNGGPAGMKSARIPIAGCGGQASSGIRSVVLQFERNQENLSEDNLAVLTWWLEQIGACKYEAIYIDGFTDDHGSKPRNTSLSEARARSVADYLAGRGLNRERLIVEWHGPEKAIASNETDVGRAQNRRVEISLVRPD